MKIIARYTSSKMMKFFLLVLPALLILTSFVDTLGLIQKHPEYELPQIASFILSSLPYHFTLVFPVALFLSVLLSSSSLDSSNQVTAMFLSGIRPGKILGYFVRTSCFLAVLYFLVLETLVPKGLQNTERLKRKDQLDITRLEDQGFTFVSDNQFYIINRFSFQTGKIYGLTILDFSPDREINRRFLVQRGWYFEDHWILEDISGKTISSSSVRNISRDRIIDNNLPPPEILRIFFFIPEQGKPESLSSFDLLKAAYYSGGVSELLKRKILVDLLARPAWLINFVLLACLGFHMGVRRRSTRADAGTPGLGILLFLLFTVINQYGYRLGYSGTLFPLLAVLLGALSLLIMIRVFKSN